MTQSGRTQRCYWTTISMIVAVLFLLSTELSTSTMGAGYVSTSNPKLKQTNEASNLWKSSSTKYQSHLSEPRMNEAFWNIPSPKHPTLLFMATGNEGNTESKEKIDIEAVTVEVGDALKAAEEAIAKSQSAKNDVNNDRYTVTSAPRVPPPPKVIDPAIRTEAIAAALGALPVGAVIGALLVEQIPELALDPLLPPLAVSFLLSTSSLVLGLQDDNPVGGIVRTLFGKPVIAIGGAFVGAIQNAVSNVVKSIQAIPGKITSAVTKQAEQTVQEIQAIPGKIQDAAVTTAQKTADSITQAAENTKAGIEQKIQQTATDIKNLPKKITLVAQDVAEEVVTEIKKTPEKISTAAQQAVDTVVESATAAAEQTVDNTKRKFEAVVEDAKQLPSKAVDEIKSLPTKAVSEFKKATNEQPKPPKLPPPPPLLENQPGVTTVTEIRPPQEPPKADVVVDFIPVPPKVGLPQIKSFPTPPAEEETKDVPPPKEPTKEEKIAKTIAEQAKVIIQSSPSISIPKLPNFESIAKSFSDTVVASSPTISIPKPDLGQKKKFDTADADERASISAAVAQVAAEERKKREQVQKEKDAREAKVQKEKEARETASKAAKEREATAKAAKEQEQARIKQQQIEAQQKEAAAQRAAAAGKAAAAATAKKQADQLARLKIDTAAADKKREAEEKQRAATAAAAQKKKVADDKQRAGAAAAAAQKKKEVEEKQRAASAAAAAQKKKEVEEKQRLIQLQTQEQQAAVAQKKQEEIAARREAIQRQKEQELEKQRQLAAERKKKEEQQKLAAAAVAKQKQAAATVTQAAKGASIRISPVTTAPTTKVAPKGVATIVRWSKRSDGGISGRIYGSTNFKDGERIETSPIVNGVVANGNVVKTGSGSRYFLSDTTPSSSKSDAPLKSLLAALPGATIQLTRDAKDKEAKRALAAVTEAKPRSTFSLFGLGGSSSASQQVVSKGTPSIKVSSSPSIPIPKKTTTTPAKKVSAAPRGVPTITRWRKNRDGSISGLIFGSSNFKDGERITTSAIAQGTIQSGQTVKTGSGSRYYLE